MQDLNDLYTRYLNKQCSPEEVRMLLAHFHLTGESSSLRPRILRELAKSNIAKENPPEVDAALKRIHHRLINDISTSMPSRSKTKWTYGIAVAAAVLLFMLIGIWFFTIYTVDRSPAIVNTVDIAPGGNKATLAMENGNTIDLSEVQDGIVIGREITYLDGTPVQNRQATGATHESVSQLILTTPKGGTYRVTLSDGTNVWLNASSTLKYPSRFAESERIVKLEGEAYFDVSKGVPFKVVSSGQTVEVLGTQFNVSAYPDEQQVQTTLVEGIVQVAAESQCLSMRLLPGEQSTLIDAHLKKNRADIASVIAWKEGLFSFNETELRVVMNQLSRWYDVTVEYQGTIPVTYYYGAISRQESLANVLDLLRQSGLNFKIDKTGGTNKVVVLP
ncbi:FecR family protein [Parapedobacter indicus]|uniref:FecR family protein n=1 Tax=Parapedobacter indicus TaxID=1477437 RepID=A0A1I3LLE9_9SPHI|nr:FecR family protein [Parapedobacter indicus]PPL01454.1 FecR family protein [Parapedobacter indicus]SFI85360.1 FecR family protein [Parapedobacter indicus]